MSIFTRFTLRSLAKNRVRTAVTIIGITLSAALLAAVLTSVTSVQAGILERTQATEGTWHIYAPDISPESIALLTANDQVSELSSFQERGSARLTDKESKTIGEFVAVRTLPHTEKSSSTSKGLPLAIMPNLQEGRMPETPDEIALPLYCRGEILGEEGGGVRSAGPLVVGTTLTLDLGQRVLDEGGGLRALNSVDDGLFEAKDVGAVAE